MGRGLRVLRFSTNVLRSAVICLQHHLSLRDANKASGETVPAHLAPCEVSEISMNWPILNSASVIGDQSSKLSVSRVRFCEILAAITPCATDMRHSQDISSIIEHSPRSEHKAALTYHHPPVLLPPHTLCRRHGRKCCWESSHGP
jgi:hypothetical protein